MCAYTYASFLKKIRRKHGKAEGTLATSRQREKESEREWEKEERDQMGRKERRKEESKQASKQASEVARLPLALEISEVQAVRG